MLNVVTREPDYPSAVLIRGVSSDGKEYDGPGKVTRLLKIDKSLHAKPAVRQSGLWFENRGERVDQKDIVTTARIGVDYAGPMWSKAPYRFVLKGTRADKTSKIKRNK